VCERFRGLDRTLWVLRDDTFPSNLALFRPGNFSIGRDSVARLTLQKERTSVREYTSTSICSLESYLYGRFVAEVKPADVPGLITGVFLHRNSPRQEIDVEFLGRDTTKLLLNVYYNPGDEGARMEYGYRGTPVLIDLGFDASEVFHRYEIEWSPASIRWRVDGRLAYERVNWDPTPIPHLPMQLNVNLWHSRSEELAGQLAGGELPAQTELRAIEILA
jgi:beta-glucanase (GH16 family)